jgi:23S rRNA (uracil1939-C5)-methyltransferase
MKEYRVQIQDLAFGGDGVGSIEAPGDELDGIRCFVPFSVPGDLLKVEIEKKTSRFVRGRITAIEQASEHRGEARCPLFGRCGGCSWQHIEYPFQLEAKRNILRQNLRRIGGIDFEPADTVASPLQYGYRGRLRMRVLDRGKLAFFAATGKELLEVEGCPLADEALNELIRAAFEGRESFPRGATVLLQVLDGKAVWEAETPGRARGRESEGLLKSRTGRRSSPGQKNRKPAGPEESGNPEDHFGSGIGFYQVNERLNLLVRDRVFEIAGRELTGKPGGADFSGRRILDLYCGNGNLSLGLAAAGAWVAGYDTNGSSLEEARKQYKKVLEKGGKTSGEGELFLKRIDALAAVREAASGRMRPFGRHRPDMVILDPPRGGAGTEIMRALCGLEAGTILYVSCDPATLARDLKEAVKQGYRLAEAIPFDMFPQTSHFESLAVLRRD